ncbi:1917_t:CDS:1, partial [Acaulospora colombiana]
MDADVSSSSLSSPSQSELSEDYQSFMETIKPPYPPRLKPQDLLPKPHDGKIRKIPNAFITYRKEFCSNLKTKNICLTMSDASFWASKLWYKESTKVRMTYQNLTMQAKVINEKMAKTPRRTKVKDSNTDIVMRGEPTMFRKEDLVLTDIPTYKQGAMQYAGGEDFGRYKLVYPSFPTAEQSSTAPQLYQNSMNPSYVPSTSHVDYCDSPSYPSLLYYPLYFPYDAQQ